MNLFATYTYGYKYDTFMYYLIWVLTHKNRENGFADCISPFKVNSWNRVLIVVLNKKYTLFFL